MSTRAEVKGLADKVNLGWSLVGAYSRYDVGALVSAINTLEPDPLPAEVQAVLDAAVKVHRGAVNAYDDLHKATEAYQRTLKPPTFSERLEAWAKSRGGTPDAGFIALINDMKAAGQ